MASGRLDPDLLAHLAANPRLVPSSSPVADVFEQRERMDTLLTKCADQLLPISDRVKETKHTITSYDGAEISLLEFSTEAEVDGLQPAFIYVHGGGGVACPIDPVCRPIIARFASDFGVRTFGVEYRFAPEHPHPTPVEDCYAALQWLTSNADRLGIDPARIAVFGESGGALIAAGLALLARDRKHSPALAKQILLYPMLDDRSSTRHFNPDSPQHQSMKTWIDALDLCWDAYLGGKRGADDVSPYGAPARAEDLKGLPPTYIDIGSMDWFKDESLEFAARLAKADVEVELHLYAGVAHGFDLLAPGMPVTLNAKENRGRAVRSV